MNVELLERVKQHILDEPRRFDMGTYLSRAEEWYSKPEERPACGTVACIAGWTVALVDGVEAARSTNLEIRIRATRLLRLKQDKAWTLFHANEWNNRYRNAYFHAGTPKKRARVAASYIDHFIKTEGAE